MPFNSQGQWIQSATTAAPVKTATTAATAATAATATTGYPTAAAATAAAPAIPGVADQVSAITSQNSPYMQVAKSNGLATANARGLLNSSMAAGASEGAAISAAAPLAESDASIAQSDRASTASIAQADRSVTLGAALQANNTYQTAFSDLANNKDIPAATREAYIQNLLDTRSTGLDMVQQVYGVNLNWAGDSGTSSTATGTGYTATPEVKPAGVTDKDWAAQLAAEKTQASAAYGA